MSGSVPSKRPGTAASSWPARVVPSIVGASTLRVGIAATRTVATDAAMSDPASFAAVTTTLSVAA